MSGFSLPPSPSAGNGGATPAVAAGAESAELAAPCPCGSEATYGECCARFHQGQEPAQPEQVMRARYCAYVRRDAAFLRRTWHPDTRPDDLTFAPGQRWVQLEVLSTTGGHLFDTEGTVEFRATFEQRRKRHTLYEHSRFVKVDGRWLYRDALDTDLWEIPPGG